MDMALELGNSIASLDARTQSRLKNSIVDGSFMVVPGSESYMSSSNMWSPNPSSAPRSNPRNNNNATNNIIKQNQAAQARAAAVGAQNARKNRVQNILQASAHHHPMTAGPSGRHAAPPIQHQQHLPPQYQNAPKPPTQQQVSPSPGLESSWWGSSSTTSQVLASSVISLGASSMLVPGEGGSQTVTSSADIGQTGANTKQIMQLMDALKTLGDENAELLREVKGAEAARMEAKAAKEQIARFKAEYGKRFTALKAALEKFRKGHPENTPVDGNEPNPVTHR